MDKNVSKIRPNVRASNLYALFPKSRVAIYAKTCPLNEHDIQHRKLKNAYDECINEIEFHLKADLRKISCQSSR